MGKSDYKKVYSLKMAWIKDDLNCSQFLTMHNSRKRWMKKMLTRFERRRGKEMNKNSDNIGDTAVQEITSYDSDGNPCAWIDLLGGTHDCGVGSDPNGEFCGECSNISCEDCKVWLRGNDK